ncbi:hypothetical protein [Lysobacter sp. HA18]
MQLSTERSGRLYRHVIDTANEGIEAWLRLLAELPRLRAELDAGAHPRLTRWVWDGLQDEADCLRSLIEDGEIDDPPPITRACPLSPGERLSLITTFVLYGEVARRVVAAVDEIAIDFPELLGADGLRRIGT